ncbi:MAG: primosomal protein N' [Pseudomonadota bacterium]
MPPKTLKIAVKTPLYRVFDYLPVDQDADRPAIGCRIRVPFGRRRTVGLVWEDAGVPAIATSKLKRIDAVIDTAPIVPADVMALLHFASQYYQHAPGEVVAAALPRALRNGEPLWPIQQSWRIIAALTAAERLALERQAPQQFVFYQRLEAEGAIEHSDLDDAAKRAAKALANKGCTELVALRQKPTTIPEMVLASAPALSDEQQAALTTTFAADGRYAATLLDGVTGSGKTEVYLRAIERTLNAGRDALVLVPEIGLTPQLVARFEARFGFAPVALHSGLSDAERLSSYRRAAAGCARIVIGTRSAVFCPLPALGLIVVDEEHDSSLKQQDGFRYSARDLAVVRAQQTDIPILLGSATPSLESLQNAAAGRYQHSRLTVRAGHAKPPAVGLIDTSAHGMTDGVSGPLRNAIDVHLGRGGQVLLHINRRGFAPTVLCRNCGHVLDCDRCDARLTLHAAAQRLWCHHCDADQPLPAACPVCQGELQALGSGSERIERALEKWYPGETIVRIDSDSTRRRGSLEAALAKATSGAARLLVGTQMLAKGHHFPELSLVGILNADQGLFGSEFRTAERLAQTLVQVAGRAGREDRAGEVLIQTDFPTHPLLATLLQDGYAGFAATTLDERRAAGWPPFAHLALLRAEGRDRDTVWKFLNATRATLSDAVGVAIYGPVKALMERRAGRYRAQLLLHATSRPPLRKVLTDLRPRLDELVQRQRVRWALDVDPIDLA